MKSTAYSRIKFIGSHIFLLALFAFLPFVFSDSLLERETTLRFLISGVILAGAFMALLIIALTGVAVIPPVSRDNHFFKILLLFLVFMALSVLKALNKGEAVYDYLKLCAIISYFFLFIVCIRKSEGFLSLLLRYINVAVLCFTLIALSQIGLQLGASNKVRIDYLLSSSLGNKNFYAETMTLFLPLLLMGAVLLRRGWRYFSVFNIVIVLGTIIALQTLSTWLAVVVMMVFMVVALTAIVGQATNNGSESRRGILSEAWTGARRRWLIPVIAIAGIGLLAVVFSSGSHFGLIRSRVNKITRYAKSDRAYEKEDVYHENSISERIYLWRNAWRMFKDHPVSGIGFDNWKIYSTLYGLPFGQYVSDNNIRFMRPHNDLILLLAEGGIVGLGMYLLLFVYAFILVRRAIRSAPDDEMKIALLLAASGLLIYLVIACFSLPGDRFYTQVLLFLFFAIICAVYDGQQPPQASQVRSGRGFMVICAVAVLSGISLSYAAWQRYSSEIHLIYALQAQSKKDWQKMGYHSAMARSWFFPADFTATPVAWYQGIASFNSGSPAISKYYFEEALRTNPYHLQVLNDLATALDRDGDKAGAAKLYDQALHMAPYFPAAYMNKVVMIYNTGAHDSAYRYLKTYPEHDIVPYASLMTNILTNKAVAAISDTAISNRYLKRRGLNLLKMDAIAASKNMTFEQYVLEDTVTKIPPNHRP